MTRPTKNRSFEGDPSRDGISIVLLSHPRITVENHRYRHSPQLGGGGYVSPVLPLPRKFKILRENAKIDVSLNEVDRAREGKVATNGSMMRYIFIHSCTRTYSVFWTIFARLLFCQ